MNFLDDKEIEITSEMTAAGVALIDELFGEVDSAYLVERLYKAMAEISCQRHRRVPSSPER